MSKSRCQMKDSRRLEKLSFWFHELVSNDENQKPRKDTNMLWQYAINDCAQRIRHLTLGLDIWHFYNEDKAVEAKTCLGDMPLS